MFNGKTPYKWPFSIGFLSDRHGDFKPEKCGFNLFFFFFKWIFEQELIRRIEVHIPNEIFLLNIPSYPIDIP